MRCLLDRSRIRCSSAAPANLVITSLSTPGGSKTNGDVVRRGDQSQPLVCVVVGGVGGRSCSIDVSVALRWRTGGCPARLRARSDVASATALDVASPRSRVLGAARSAEQLCEPLREAEARCHPRGCLRRARRASRTRSDRSREVPPRLLRSKTPGRNAGDARRLPTSRSTTNNPYTRPRRHRARASGESGAAGHVGAKTGPFLGESDGNCLPNLARGRQPG